MNWKLIVLGGLAFYAVQWVVSMISQPLIHEGLLEATYKAHELFWRPELTQEPPDMAALMPRWIATGLITTFVLVGIYGWLRPGMQGGPCTRGLKFGIMMAVISGMFMAGWSGLFALPDSLWLWWSAEHAVMYVIAGPVLGWVAHKVAPLQPAT